MADDEPMPDGFGVPTTTVNRFSIRAEGTIVTIVFGDALVGNHVVFHLAVVMSPDDALALAKSIQDTIAKNPPNPALES
jgi:hypothetical protein